MLEQIYEGWGFDTDDQRLYGMEGLEMQAENEDGYDTRGMMTLAVQKVIAFDPELDVVDANKYTQVYQFVSENGANYTDLRQGKCGCCD